MFDTSSSSTKRGSLNDNLEKGLNFNSGHTMTADKLQKRERGDDIRRRESILANLNYKQERDARRFLSWKHGDEGNITEDTETWRMTRVTFGTAPSTFLLAAKIKHHLKAMETEFPVPVNKLQKATLTTCSWVLQR